MNVLPRIPLLLLATAFALALPAAGAAQHLRHAKVRSPAGTVTVLTIDGEVERAVRRG